MTIKHTVKLAILTLAGYGGYTLWNRYDSARGAIEHQNGVGPYDRRIDKRSELTVSESAAGSDNPVAQATAILTDSDERSHLPRTADGVEHRRSQDTVMP